MSSEQYRINIWDSGPDSTQLSTNDRESDEREKFQNITTNPVDLLNKMIRAQEVSKA